MKYKCKNCGWIGERYDILSSDYYDEDGVYIWQEYICPECYEWQDLDDYEEIME